MKHNIKLTQIIGENKKDIRRSIKEDWPSYKIIATRNTNRKWKNETGTIWNIELKQTIIDKLIFHFNRFLRK